ncbi:MAG: hypothetical protein ABIV48_07970 [Pyrinomonadaceae bacterium]
MNSSSFRLLVFLVLSVPCFTTAGFSQTFEYKDGRKLQIEFVQEPPCPVKISVKSVDLTRDSDRHVIMLQIENVSSTPIRAYGMISGGNVHPNLHTAIFGSAPFAAGETILRGVWPNSQEHYYFFFDYILFEDGSVCGLDNSRRSIQIKSYLDARAEAITRLKELVADHVYSDEIINPVTTGVDGGYLSFDNPGPPNPDTIKAMPRRAWEHVIMQLRRIEKRKKEAVVLAARLEKEKPV